MSSYDGGGFEEWVRDSVFHTVPENYIQRVMQLLAPWRETIDEKCDDFDEETQSWRDYRNSLWEYIPKHINDEVDAILEGKSKWCTFPMDVPMTPYARKPQTVTVSGEDWEIRVAVSAGTTPKGLAATIEAHLRMRGLPI